MELKIMLKDPEFPVICNIDNVIVPFASAEDMVLTLPKFMLKDGGNYVFIDSNARGFILSVRGEFLITGPDLFKTRWTKQKLVNLCNSRFNKRSDTVFVLEKPGSKRMRQVMAELAEFLRS